MEGGYRLVEDERITAIELRWGMVAAHPWETVAQLLADVDEDELLIGWAAADLSARTMAWDIDCNVSVAATGPDGALAAVGLLGRREERGWIGALAVAPVWRGHGVERVLLGRLIAAAQALPLSSLIVEANCDDAPALTLFAEAGFEDGRELLLWERSPEMGPLPVPDGKAEKVDPVTLMADWAAWHTARPRWQGEWRSLQAGLADCQGWQMREGAEVVAYALTQCCGDDLVVVDVGVAPGKDARGTARPLLQALQLLHGDRRLVVVPWPAEDPLSRVLAALGFRVALRRRELTRRGERLLSRLA